jgi:tellurite resistance protein
MNAPKAATPNLDKFAAEIRKDLNVPKQNEVFAHAVEAGYLAAMADGSVDEEELAAIVKAVEMLSVGAVVEWEATSLLDECKDRIGALGIAARTQAVSAKLKELGAAEAGLLFAAFVAQATKGIDKSETEVLMKIGTDAGLPKGRLLAILKRVGAQV